MSERDSSTRLAKLEGQFDFIKDLLKEIRDDVKTLPIKEDYDKLEKRVDKLEKSQNMLAIKIGSAAGIIGLIAGIAIKILLGT